MEILSLAFSVALDLYTCDAMRTRDKFFRDEFVSIANRRFTHIYRVQRVVTHRLYSFPFACISSGGKPDIDFGVPCPRRISRYQLDICAQKYSIRSSINYGITCY